MHFRWDCVLRRLPPVGCNNADVEQCGQFDALLHVDLIPAAGPRSDQCGSGLNARGFHSAFFFYGHEAILLLRPAQPETERTTSLYKETVVQWLAGWRPAGSVHLEPGEGDPERWGPQPVQ